MSGVVIVGGGQAAFQVGASLRQLGYRAPVTIVGDEPSLPYGRPALSKSYLAGKIEADGLRLRPAAFYDEQGIVVRSGESATSIAREERQVVLASGDRLAYDHLVLATGARNRALPVPGHDLRGIYYLRTMGDADELKAELGRVASVVVIGAGFIGLEFAAVCAAAGIAVTVLEAATRVLARSTSPLMAATIQARHLDRGVRFAFGASVQAIEGSDRAVGVRTNDGRMHPADLVLIGVGVLPNQELAARAGLVTSDGIVVDEHLVTSDPLISAVGDCAAHPSPHADGARVRIESVQSAVDGARCVAARLTGRPVPHVAVPWFWSDQGTDRLQIAGLAPSADRVVRRGMPDSGRFSVLLYQGTRLVAVESLNRPADHMLARRLLEVGIHPSPDQAGDSTFDLKSLLPQGSS